MAKAIVDPEELRRFAQDLKRFNEQLGSQMTAIQARLNTLGQTWRDQEHSRFAEEFISTMKVLSRFVDASNQHIPFLLRKAEHIENYLQQR
jgi:uncharacterized protein YukE